MSEQPNRVVVAITGASGTVYGIRALEMLRAMTDVETHLIMTPAARTTLAIESAMTSDEVEALADVVHPGRDIGASIASGSFRTAGMLVAPCSIKSLSAIANSYSSDLVGRAADVTLKERRPLVLMVRETPLHHGHLRLMTQVAEMGGILMPPVPAFYNRPETLDDVISHTAGRAIELLGLEVADLERWTGRP